ncbi:MAG: BCCT family transporter [Pseudomonadota bacterium]
MGQLAPAKTRHWKARAQMNEVLSIAILVTLCTSLVLVLLFRDMRLEGKDPMALTAFMAILFTSGLDVGLIMFPLTEFPVYETEAAYGFTNALAIEFGFWGFLVWGFYFLTTFYFCAVEPKLKLFEIGWIKTINSAVIIATCAFTGFLFLSYLPSYIDGITDPLRYGLVAAVVLLAVLSSTDIRYVKWLGLGSSVLFFGLIALLWLMSGSGLSGLAANLSKIGGYFANLPKFTSPVTDYHAFYLFWWFAWSIMIGQFVARFVGGFRPYQLMIALLLIPSIPIALWFSVLYYYHANGIELIGALQLSMVVVGIIFVINSLDSLTRLYSENLGLTVHRLGGPGYVAAHWTLLFGLILLYQFTPLKIEWIGLVVIGLYCVIYALTFTRRDAFNQPAEPQVAQNG